MEGIEFMADKDKLVCKINTKLHQKEAIIAAGKEFTDDFYLTIDGNPDDFIQAIFVKKSGKIDTDTLKEDFSQMLYAVEQHQKYLP